jgi:hypothetical protein
MTIPEDEEALRDLERSRLDNATPNRHDMDEFVPDGLEDEANVTPELDPAAEEAAMRTGELRETIERE